MTTKRQERAAYFDGIGEQYSAVDTGCMLLRRYSEVYTLLELMGDLSGKSVLDLGCSDGFFTRKYKRQGAARVVGVDLSETMIDLAREEESRDPLGITYVVGDALALEGVGSFDLIATPFLLNYAQTKDELLHMCRTIYANLKPGGRLISMNDHPKLNSDMQLAFAKYGLTKTFTGQLYDGSPLTITMIVRSECGDSQKVAFTGYYFRKETLDWALQNAGFLQITWHHAQVSPQGVQRFGQEFWQDFLDQPSNAFIEGKK